MSQKLVSLNPDLKRLQNEGYNVSTKSTYLLVDEVPYVNSSRQIKRGTLVSELTLTAGNRTTKPSTHVVMFIGEHPCNTDGSLIAQIRHASNDQRLDESLVINHSFSNKPANGYNDYYEKMNTYATIISSPAQALDPDVTPKTFRVVETTEEESVFNYDDSSSSRSGITLITKSLELGKVAIVGVGGTGSYILDLIAKTPIKEIYLFDGDRFLQHNAFRAPGAVSVDDLKQELSKVAFFKQQYSKFRRNIVAVDSFIDAANVYLLKDMDFVFLCVDKGSVRKMIVKKLEEWGTKFIDVGMGVERADNGLLGVVRVTTSTAQQRDHIKNRIAFSDGVPNEEYASNIQIADLNSLNASLAVIKWKKMFGFYQDTENEYHSTYSTNCNLLTSEDRA